MSSVSCIFCRIISGQVPAALVASSPLSLAFLDASPLNFGHTLVIPKRHADDFLSLTPAEVSDLFCLTQKVSKAVQAATKCTGFNLLQNNGALAGQTVFHSHVHIIPRRVTGEVFQEWNTTNYASSQQKEFYQESIRAAIKTEENKIQQENTKNEKPVENTTNP